MLPDELLDIVRRRAGCADVAFAEPPARLSGGFFTENWAFRLAAAPPPWSAPLVVRLFPSISAPELACREATTQRVLCAQGFPAAPVLWFDDSARLCGRRFFVMERLPGNAMMGGIRVRELAGAGWHLLRRLPEVTASVQASLHDMDAAPLVTELGAMPSGPERWFDVLDEQIRAGATGLAPGLDWLVKHAPSPPPRPSICHGDLWGGNILVDDGRVMGVLDWSTVTVAHPALDVGFTAMSLSLAPIDAPSAIQRTAAAIGSAMRTRYVRAYQRARSTDLSMQPYYEALRCAVELSLVAAYRMAEARGTPHDVPRLTWDSIADRMIAYFRRRTGVTLGLPA